MGIRPTFRERLANLNFSDIAKVAVLLYLLAMASAATNRSDTTVLRFVDANLHVSIPAQLFLFNLSFMGAFATFLLLDSTWFMVIWLAWPTMFNASTLWQVIQSPTAPTTHSVNGMFILIIVTALVVVTEIFEQRQKALLGKVYNHEKECQERCRKAVADALREAGVDKGGL